MDTEKKSWFLDNHSYLALLADSPNTFLAALAYSEVVESYLNLFPNSTFNADYAEYLKEIE